MNEPFHKMHNEKRQRKVNEFLVWRAGQSVDWQCTVKEIAAETKLSEKTVRLICKDKGWNTETIKVGSTGRNGVDTFYRNGFNFDAAKME